MVFAELARGVALRFKQFSQRGILLGQSFLRSGKAHLEQAGAERGLARNERSASGRAGLLGIEVGKNRALFGDAINIGRAVSHTAAVVGTGVPIANVVTEDDKNVGLLDLGPRRRESIRA